MGSFKFSSKETMASNPLQSPFSSNFLNFELPAQNPDHPSFQLSDFLVFDGGSEEPATPAAAFPDNSVFENFHDSNQSDATDAGNNAMGSDQYGMERIRMEPGLRIAFRTKSELENLDDGFKWRKYGKKTVKNSPNPRNYYRCSNSGCPVKKRIERDREDRSYVITTYEGVHNHESPSLYYNPHQSSPVARPEPSPLVAPQPWSSQTAYSTL